MKSLIASLLGAGALSMLASLAGCVGEADESTDVDVVADEQAVGAAAQSMRFGVAPQWYQSYNPPSEGPAAVDVVVVGDWLIENGFTDAHQRKVEQIRAKRKVPYFFGYIATALTKKGVGATGDCDGNTSAPLCQRGADYLRSHIDSEIVPAYREAASKIGRAVGRSEALIHIEPDWFQFSEKAQRNAFSREESNGYMNKILHAIRQGCGSCKVVIDFSPWFSADKTKWARSARDFYSGWDRDVVKYVGLTGKPFPFTEGKIDNFTYAQITREVGLPLVVVDGYTFGGGPIDVDATWLNRSNVAKAVDMGVDIVILSQQGNVAGYDRFIRQLRGDDSTPPPPDPPTPPSDGEATVSGGNVKATVSTASEWNGGFCKNIALKNRDSKNVTWTVRIPKRGTISNAWSVQARTQGSDFVFTGVDYNKTLSPGQSADFGYCVSTQ